MPPIFLENSLKVIGFVRFFGVTPWTNCALYGDVERISRDWFDRNLAAKNDSLTVVVMHNAPLIQPIAPNILISIYG